MCRRVATRLAHRDVVEDTDDRRAGFAALADQVDHAVTVGGVERRGRLVEQQDRIVGDQRAGDVDPLLLAAGEGRGRQGPQSRGNAEQAEQELGTATRFVQRSAAPHHWLGHDIDGADPRDHAQELADEADGMAANIERDAGLGADQLDPPLSPGVAMADLDRAGLRPVVAVERAQQGALARAGEADQRQALARRNGEGHVLQHGQRQVTLRMHHEGLVESGNAQDREHRHYTGRIEATSIWV